MANEVRIVEQQEVRGRTEIKVAPFLAVQSVSIGALSAAFNKGTKMVSVHTSGNCNIEFSNLDGTAPDGAGAGSGVIPLIAAEGWVDFSVRGGDKLYVAA